ncbi:MAG: [FeFe] hydrogenase H-cluster radical SAM maturase HydE [Ruminococcaceae bacterium]|nr:[FeFe] hydrogenase H-cluster radical SAM maturase HydE [Oscillospiraceae bacterium]
MNNILKLIDKLEREHSLSLAEYEFLLENRNEETTEYLRKKAENIRKSIYGNAVFIRGLIEISNICKNDCFYCGIRKSNTLCQRYRLTPDEILSCAENGYKLGFRTFVLQGGEDGFFTDKVLCDIVKKIKALFPDCAITLSMGERSEESYRLLKKAGADRYLLRHEAINEELYSRLHPEKMLLKTRINCLQTLKKLGFQTGCGFMVGAPFQNNRHIAEDLKFIEEFQPEMCGIGPFVPHKDTPFGEYPGGSAELTCFLLSIIRLIKPNILLPSTTALGTIHPEGRELGILSGANVVMPNLSPENARKKYALYNNKLNTGAENAFHITQLKNKIEKIGYEIVTDRGDIRKD